MVVRKLAVLGVLFATLSANAGLLRESGKVVRNAYDRSPKVNGQRLGVKLGQGLKASAMGVSWPVRHPVRSARGLKKAAL